ncbi:GPCR, PTH11-type [Hyaloscypha variabilis F]|uniref:GPCR, PTH11-type n=1 Tax=Hyaloscypha variabilis (strain UAMH 11265 / GT02V1 / F) TaxID=1149755 RepID=A0A2J6RZ02_HYAVF|nr:GPCR, PTH11-type [Hyaloscypha variabilis F]
MSTNSSQPSQAELGAELSAAAYAQPPIKPEGLALRLIIVIWVTAVIATIVVGLRVYVRAWMLRRAKVWGWEDTFAVMGYLAFLCSSIFAIKAASYGLGTRDSGLNTFLMVRCAEYLLYSEVVYGVSMPLIKASVVFTLLRITTEKKYRWSLYIMQFIATAMAIVGILASLLYCKPVKAYWNPLLGTCGDFMTVVKIGYAWTAVGIFTDWAYAIIPYLIVRKLQMSARNKTTVMVILGLAAVASTATIVRAPYLQYYLVTKDRLYWNGYISLWCQLESGIGLIAACLPALRKLFTRYFESSRNGSNAKSKQYIAGSRNIVGSQTQMDNLSPAGKTTISIGKWKRLGDGNSSTSHIILHETTVTVETESMNDEEKQARRV